MKQALSPAHDAAPHSSESQGRRPTCVAVERASAASSEARSSGKLSRSSGSAARSRSSGGASPRTRLPARVVGRRGGADLG